MVEFRWKTEGTRPAGVTDRLPASACLLIIIGFAYLVTIVVTGKVSEQEKTFQVKQLELEAKMNAKHIVVCVKRRIAEGDMIKPGDIGMRELDETKVPIDALSNTSEAIGKHSKCTLSVNDIVCQHLLIYQSPSK
jgi:flagella basal body P-ring formation protein FlgA